MCVFQTDRRIIKFNLTIKIINKFRNRNNVFLITKIKKHKTMKKMGQGRIIETLSIYEIK